MKLIIDINEVKYNEIMKYVNTGWNLPYLETIIANGTPIPDNATNGDVIKALFKPNRITRTGDTVNIEYDLTFTPEWWNAPAPYQKGGKE